MKKRRLIAAGIGLALVAGIIFLAFTFNRGVVNAGSVFLSQIGSGKVPEAYESASATLKSQQTVREFEEGVKRLGLTEYTSAAWTNFQADSDRGQLEGFVTTRSGGRIPLHIELIRESGKWKVYSVSAPQAGVITKDFAKSVPSDDELNAMTLETLLAFNKAVKNKSFVDFQNQWATANRAGISPEELMENFKTFIDNHIDISSIERVRPVFESPPIINSEGVLILKGYYPTKPKQVVFGIKYLFESSGWKLETLNLDIPEPTGSHPLPPTPSGEMQKKMVVSSLTAFKKAVQEGSFTAFHQECASQLRGKVSVEQFNDSFKPFMGNGVDISAIEKEPPVFDASPRVDSDGVLAIAGKCPGEPEVGFQLKYVYEDGKWRIIEITVNGFLVKFA